jgi:hypothetical protein
MGLLRVHGIVRSTMMTLLAASAGSAQFSPGELSAPHSHLEGMSNCTKCHEIGKEISGKKCLGCHEEIQSQLSRKQGFHFRCSKDVCVKCHKEHVGRDSRTVVFTEQSFDHGLTGFSLAGAHLRLKCERCHTPENIKDRIILNLLAEHPHKTYLGLDALCSSCHRDIHSGRFSQPCTTCHGSDAWSPAISFNHEKTGFALTGKHREKKCRSCHPSLSNHREETPLTFEKKDFNDCSPCHQSPHGLNFQNRECKSCHSTDGWRKTGVGKFDHDLTGFQLVGRHRELECRQCHGGKGNRFSSLRPSFRKCTDCHKDAHSGQFVAKYMNDCSACHTEQGFTPSTFTLAMHHEKSRFGLSGAHTALPCSSCHKRLRETRSTFHFANLQCEACHVDQHGGQFSDIMKPESCEKCHTADYWKKVSFDHSATKFPLTGRHESLHCIECHKDLSASGRPQQHVKLVARCESCHRDPHFGQFATNGRVECGSCHTPSAWKHLIFSHETQSAFPLRGGHARLDCRACHRSEQSGGATLVRYKPLATECESCHQQRN